MDFISLLGATGGPSVVAVGAFYLLIRHEMKGVKENIREMRKDHAKCQDKRVEVEEAIHDRVTKNQTTISRILGVLNGNGKGIKA